jgi:hypothetical protein
VFQVRVVDDDCRGVYIHTCYDFTCLPANNDDSSDVWLLILSAITLDNAIEPKVFICLDKCTTI